jgi:hypothetical protein
MDVLLRHGLRADSPVRLIEIRGGLLLVPVGDEPMSSELAEELNAWQELSAESWDLFPYEGTDG